jgi:hypothetical protein
VSPVKKKAGVVNLRFLVDKQPFLLGLEPDEAPGFGLTPRETGRLRRLSAASGAEMFRRLGDLDAEVLAALCIIAVERAGQTIDEDAVLDGKTDWEVDFTSLTETDAAPLEANGSHPTTMIPDGTGLQPSDTTSVSSPGG